MNEFANKEKVKLLVKINFNFPLTIFTFSDKNVIKIYSRSMDSNNESSPANWFIQNAFHKKILFSMNYKKKWIYQWLSRPSDVN